MLVSIENRKKVEKTLHNMNNSLSQQMVYAKEFTKEAEVADIAKNDFLANMNHEIRTQ